MAYEKLKKTIATAGTAGVPKSPLGNFPELRGYYASSFELPQSQAGANALASTASADAAAARAAASSARSQQQAELKKKIRLIEQYQKGEGYEKVKKEDGGFDFFDTFGRKIDVKTYADVQNKKVADVLGDSENNLDRQFLDDHDFYEKTLNALHNNDGKFFEDMKKKNPSEFTALSQLTDNFKKTPEEVSRAFLKLYGDFYKGGTTPELRGGAPPPSNKEKVIEAVRGRANDIPLLGRLIPDEPYGRTVPTGPFSQFRRTLGGF